MKTIVLAVATLFTTLSVTAVYAQSGDKLNPGDALPTVTQAIKSVNSKPINLSTAKEENGLIVMFSCNTCPFVVKNEPITKKVMDFAAAHHVGMVIINSNEAQRGSADSYEAMKKYAEAQGYKVPYLIDDNSKLADMFGANHTPEVFLFNNQNRLVYKGAMNDNPSNPDSYKKMYIEDAITAMIAGKDPDPKTTKSIGCSIKRKA
jgi:thioredoxin-related protein